MTPSPKAILLAILLTGTPLLAQEPAPRAPFEDVWISAAVGGAGARLTCDLCQTRRELGPAAELAIGSYARPDLRIGLEAGGWAHEDGDERESVFGVGVLALYRPLPARGFYLVGGAGWARYRATQFNYDAPRIRLGAGWDYPLAGRIRIGNQLTIDAASFGSLRNEEQRVAREVGLSVVRLTVQLNRY